jgi:hypothetical protein
LTREWNLEWLPFISGKQWKEQSTETGKFPSNKSHLELEAFNQECNLSLPELAVFSLCLKRVRIEGACGTEVDPFYKPKAM